MAPLPGVRRRADIVFTKQKLAVFIDGCFWHGCLTHKRLPETNIEYWRQKISRNRERDEDTGKRFLEAGWKTLRVWEHESVDDAVQMVIDALKVVDGKAE